MSLHVEIKTKPLAAIQSLGELLIYTREQQERTVQEAASELKISPLYLQALEQGQYDRLPCLIYSRNFVKGYAKWLGLDHRALTQLFEKEYGLHKKLSGSELEDEECTGIKRTDFWKLPRWISWGASMMLVLAVLSYFGYELYALREAPMLVVESPSAEIMINKQLIEIKGKTEPESALTINNQTILSDADGNFDEMVALQPGVNTIKISSKKKHSQEATVFRTVIVEGRSQFSNAGNRIPDNES